MDIIQAAREFGASIQATDLYRNLMEAKRANDNDAELAEQIGKFNLIKLEIQHAASQSQPNQKLIDQKNEQLRDLYDAIMKNEHMIAFQNASDQVNQMMSQINTILSTAVNGGDPATCPTDSGNCEGNCANCGGCH